ncbi:MAG: tRNA (adenosine(37)-N6)-dimethylallyltransferase MiaA [Bacteroidia bacterium]
MAAEDSTLIIVCGPTASGKTDFAIELAQHFNTEILSVDSRQIYKEMSIGTAKPSAEKLKLIPHHFINHCSIYEHYNAGIFEKEAFKLLENLFQKYKVVVASGGTGMYIKALCEGLDELPIANENLRQQLQKELDENGVDYIYKKLQNLDFEGSKTVDGKNPHRIMRALELVTETGQSILKIKTNPKIKRPFKIVKLMMDLDRATLYHRINSRVDEMINEGLVEEARNLFPFKNLKALQSVGYSELFEYFEGNCSLAEAIEKIKQHTRNYAKRQLTWFRKGEDLMLHHQFNRDEINQVIE